MDFDWCCWGAYWVIVNTKREKPFFQNPEPALADIQVNQLTQLTAIRSSCNFTKILSFSHQILTSQNLSSALNLKILHNILFLF